MKTISIGAHNKGLTIEQLPVGLIYEESFVITADMIESFARITWEHNPIHLDEDYAKGTIFGTRVAQGMLLGGLLSGVLGTHFPGVGTIYLSQSLKFLRPVFIGDEVTLRLEVLEVFNEKNRIRLRTVFTNRGGQTVVNGEAVVMPPPR